MATNWYTGKPAEQDADEASSSSKGGTGSDNITTGTARTLVPPGVDPYYGITVMPLGNLANYGYYDPTTPVTPPTTPPPNTTDGLGGGKTWNGGNPDPSGGTDLGDLTARSYIARSGVEDPGYMSYLRSLGMTEYYGSGGALDYANWKALTTSNNTGGTGGNTASGGFMVARPNMTWVNSLPSVIPPGGQALADMYGPTPFTRAANTPGVTYTKPSLTYNNPYNTNPYLPLSNPFALIANNTGNTNG